MKKAFFILSVATLAIATSCSEDEPLAVNKGDEISFRSSMGNLTRATETTNANLNSMYVTALLGDKNYFSNEHFTKGSDGYFTSPAKYYWPGDNSTLKFYAYSPSQDELGADITIDNGTKVLESFTPVEEIANQVDFITADTIGSKDVNEAAGVPLTFKHRLAQIELQAKTDNKTYVYKVTGMRIGRPEITGTFDFGTNKWTLDSWHETTVYESSCDEVTLGSDPVSIMGTSGNAMLLPQTLTAWDPIGDPDNVARGAYLSIKLNISTPEGVQIYPFPTDTIKDETGSQRKFAWASIPLSGTWEQGKKYIYTLDLTNGAGNVDPDELPIPGKPVVDKDIKFTVNVENWIDTPAKTPMTPKVK